MKEMLNLIEAYLDMVGHSAYRIDGSMGQVGGAVDRVGATSG